MATYDPEYLKAMEPMLKAKAAHPLPPLGNSYEIRARSNKMMGAALAVPYPPGVTETRIDVPGPDGHTVAVYRFATAEQLAGRSEPAVVFVHGGGMVAGSVALYAATVARQTAEFGIQHFAVDYRLAPDVTATQMLEDCYSGLAYVSAHAAALGVDAARIGMAGESAGAGLATGTTLMARDRGLQPPLAKLLAVYPMLDDATVSRHPPPGARHPGANTADDGWAKRPLLTWNTEQNAMGWASYLGVGRPGLDGPLEAAAALAAATADPDALPPTITPYSVPARAPSLVGMPSTYMDVGMLDLFAEEVVQFAARLARDGVDLAFHAFPGLPHAFDVMAPSITASRTARELQRRAYNSF